MSLDFLKGVTRDLEKAGIDMGASEPPRYWFSTGNYVLNKIISGSFMRGIPQGRITAFVGPSQSGKSFLIGNLIREAQKEGAFVLVLDSENALDNQFVSAIGGDPSSYYKYVSVDTIPQVRKVVSTFLMGYKAENGNDHDAPKIVIVIDSLDMLITETEMDHFEKGVTKGDQGQRNKQLKAMLRDFVQAVKRPNVSMVITDQVYRNQDVMNGEGVWMVKDAVKYSLSQIVMLGKLKLKDTGSRVVKGIRMKVEGYKTRFAKPYQVATIEVPYDTGMDPYNGLLEVAVEMGKVVKKGSRYALAGEDKSWYSRDFGEYAPDVLIDCEADTDHFLNADIDDAELDNSKGKSVSQQRKDNLTSKKK